MTHRRARHLGVAATALAAVALLPAAAGGLRLRAGRVAHHRPLRRLERLRRRRTLVGRVGRDQGSSRDDRPAGPAAAGRPRAARGPRHERRDAVHEDYAYIGSRTDGGHGDPQGPFSVWDISQVPDGGATTTLYSGLYPYQRFPAPPSPAQKPTGRLHSLTISNDGTRACFALLTGGFAVVDVSDLALGNPMPQPRPITVNDQRPVWEGPGAHSAVKLWTATGPGCPTRSTARPPHPATAARGAGRGWSTSRIRRPRPSRPTTASPRTTPPRATPGTRPGRPTRAHNPTLTPHVAFSTWHSGGLQARPAVPATGRNEKVVMWSYVVIQDRLLYVVDLRNGLYVLEYDGPYEREVRKTRFLDGNSNQGDALCYEPVGRAPRRCR